MAGSERIAPFLRWAGGKRWFCNKIHKYLPNDFTDYYEPFLGGGAIFFYLYAQGYLKENIHLSDFNQELMLAYRCVRDDYDSLAADLDGFEYTEDEYYIIRDRYNSNTCTEYEKGLYFLYLNITGFNGIYRVSRDGKYNVPYGHRVYINDNYPCLLKNDSQALRNVDLSCHSFSSFLDDSDFKFAPKSLVFIDPPYTVSHNNNGFIEYNKKIFDLDSQIKLRTLLDKIDMDDAYFIMTNARHYRIREIFDGYYFHDESRASIIGGKNARRGIFQEYVVTNFAIEKEESLWQ